MIKIIRLKKDTPEKTITQFSNFLEKRGKFLASQYDKDSGSPEIVCDFDNEMDYQAMLIALAK